MLTDNLIVGILSQPKTGKNNTFYPNLLFLTGINFTEKKCSFVIFYINTILIEKTLYRWVFQNISTLTQFIMRCSKFSSRIKFYLYSFFYKMNFMGLWVNAFITHFLSYFLFSKKFKSINQFKLHQYILNSIHHVLLFPPSLHLKILPWHLIHFITTVKLV